MQARLGPLENGPQYLGENFTVNLSPSHPWGDLQPFTRLTGQQGKELMRLCWIDPNSRKPKMSLWSTLQHRGSWRSSDLISGPSWGEPSESSNPPCGYSSSSGKHDWSRYSQQMAGSCTGSLTSARRAALVAKADGKPQALPYLAKQ